MSNHRTRHPPTTDTPGRVVVGVDGCKGGWVVVTTGPGPSLAAEVVTDLIPVIEAVRRRAIDIMAIDMPIGLLDDRPRLSDRETRMVLGPRRASVFATPVRAVLAATTYREACDLSRQASGRALSKQTWYLVDRIRQLDELLLPSDAHTIVEAHPECAFLRLAGETLPSKHQTEGRQLRHRLLARHLGRPFQRLWAAAPAPPLDLLDAAVLTITACHVAAGTAITLGPEIDATGKLAQVVY
jgi:predicted RNase H-like nuclease